MGEYFLNPVFERMLPMLKTEDVGEYFLNPV